MSDEASSDEESFDEELLVRNFEEEAQLLVRNLLPQRSKESYIKAYDEFMNWQKENHAGFEESVFLVYFEELSKTRKPPSLWSIWSKLKATLNINGHVNLDDYERLRKYISVKNTGYKPKRSSVLSLDQINKFLMDANDKIYLAMKAMVIVAFFGCLRCQEILNLKLSDFEDYKTSYIVNVNETKTYITRNFVISREYYDIVKKYRLLRPKELKDSDRFFVTYREGKCIRSFIGKNKISEVPRIIASFLELPEPDTYTGHCYRRSSATALSHAGANLTTLKYHGGWKSDRVAQSYVDHSKFHREKVFNMISNTEVDPKNHFTNHPPVNNIFIPSKQLRNQLSTRNESISAAMNSSNFHRPSISVNASYASTSTSHTEHPNDSRDVSCNELQSSKDQNPNDTPNVNNLSDTDSSVKATISFGINENNNSMEHSLCKPSTSSNKICQNLVNNKLANLSDDYDDILATIDLDNTDDNQKDLDNTDDNHKSKTAIPESTEQNKKQNIYIETGESCSKKNQVKSKTG